MESFLLRLELLIKQFQSTAENIDNKARRQIYSDLQILLLDLEEFYALKSIEYDDEALDLIKRTEDFTKSLSLKPLQRQRYIIDDICRFAFINSGLFFLGVYGSLPLLIINVLESFLSIPSSRGLAVRLRMSYAWLMLKAAGVSTEVRGLDDSTLSELEKSDKVSLLTFAHNSNFDGFLVSLTCPMCHYALAKKELFIIPFFSWLSLAIGGVPVDRQNRDRAIKALERSTKDARSNKICLVIAPEGTRSTTGQLLDFKKGTFYMWEQLKSPIIPFINFGGFDLFPVGNWLNTPGHVVIQYLPVISPHEATNRDAMLRLLRRRMLEALRKTPESAGAPLTLQEYIKTYFISTIILLFNVYSVRWVCDYLSSVCQLSFSAISFGFLGGCFGITISLYLYNVFIIDWVRDTLYKSKN